MAEQSNDRRWADMKARLKTHDRDSLLTLVHDLYELNSDNRRFIHARLAGSPEQLATYKRLVADAIFPDIFSRKRVRVGEAQRLIREFEKASADAAGTVDLMLTFLEKGTEQIVFTGYDDEAYFGALERMIDTVVKRIRDLPIELHRESIRRFSGIVKRGASIAWGYGEHLRDAAAGLSKPSS